MKDKQIEEVIYHLGNIIAKNKEFEVEENDVLWIKISAKDLNFIYQTLKEIKKGESEKNE